jgi:putative FmdB family regulatory protein
MPIYEYLCPDCELKFELLRPLSRAGEGASCPVCQRDAHQLHHFHLRYLRLASGQEA